ncbi:glutathione synthetase, ATP-grasp domain [Desulfonatronum zhilinae]|nr:glutathione synthetase, ATP-grasp domain [Desulfonatronum zhilinae]
MPPAPHHPTADVALLTESRYAYNDAAPDDWYLRNILRDDELLQNALAALGLSSVRLDWAASDVDWSAFRCAVFRTTWDYFDRIVEFSAWLRRIQTQTRLCNAPETIWWNLDKHYLADLQARGVPVVPFRLLEPDAPQSLRELLEVAGWEEAVLKPCVSGGARHTYRVHRDDADALQEQVRPLLVAEAFLLQPFIHDVIQTGEDTVMVVNGRVTHAVRKVPKAGDFRVQDDHGGTVHHLEPTREHVELAQRAMAACEPAPSYGRVDMVRDEHGKLAVMELELIEPELWLREHLPAAEEFAQAIAQVVADPLLKTRRNDRESPVV